MSGDKKEAAGYELWCGKMGERYGLSILHAVKGMLEDWIRVEPRRTNGPIEKEAFEIGLPLYRAYRSQQATVAQQQWQQIVQQPGFLARYKQKPFPPPQQRGQGWVTQAAMGAASMEAKVLLNYASFCDHWPPKHSVPIVIPSHILAEASEYHHFHLNSKFDPERPSTVGHALSQFMIGDIVPLFANYLSGKGSKQEQKKPPDSAEASKSVIEWEAAVTARILHQFTLAINTHPK